MAAAGRLRGDRGSLSLMMVVVFPGLLLMIGLAVDGGAKVQATQRANAIADEAARAGGQILDRGAALGSGGYVVDPAAAVAAAEAYLAANDVPGSAAVVDGDTLLVTTTITTETIFLSAMGIDTMTVTGSGSADLVPD